MSETLDPLPSLKTILVNNPGWLDEAISTPNASTLTGVPTCTLETWRSRGGGPPFLKLGKTVRYQRRALFNWMARKQRKNTSDDGTDHG